VKIRLNFLPLDIAILRAKRTLVPFCFDVRGRKVIYLAMNDGTVGSVTVKRGNIICSSLVLDDYFLIAKSFYAFLSSHITNCEIGHYKVIANETAKEINLFPAVNLPSATTNGVTIEASVSFIHELSIPTGGRFHWAYSIHMFMDSSLPAGIHNCQLVSRHWEIEYDGEVETVDGPGVIGKYPKMYPSADFVYQSCCPLGVPQGSMKGSFKMVRTDNSYFDATVPQFQFRIPDVLEEKENL